MLVLNLACSQAHRFEGWFGSAADFESQTERGLLTCPMCGVDQVRRMPSAPHLNVSHLRSAKFASAAPAASAASDKTPAPSDEDAAATRPASPLANQPSKSIDPTQTLQALQAAVEQWVAEAIATTEDVGQQFAEEARRIHYGEAQARGIRGQATLDETLALSDEGIEVIALPMAPGAKNKLQ